MRDRMNEALGRSIGRGQINPELPNIGPHGHHDDGWKGGSMRPSPRSRPAAPPDRSSTDHRGEYRAADRRARLPTSRRRGGRKPCRFFTAAREIGKSERTIGMINFFNGYALVRQADGMLREATTAAPARRAMPILERAKVMLDGAGAYTEQAAQRANLLQNVRQYIEVADALIRAGR
jgi:hypothetical protein